MKPHMTLLDRLGACSEASIFAAACPNLKQAWETCNRPDWIIWFVRHLDFNDTKMFRLYACWCVRNTPLGDGRKGWDLLTDKRSRDAVEVAERFAEGNASREELATARDAAGAAAWAVGAAVGDAAGAAWAARAARAAAGDAGDARAAARDAGAAGDAARDAQTNRLRELIPYSTVSKLVTAYNRKRKAA